MKAMRPYDGFGRFGGEEFLVVVPLACCSDVSAVLERVRQAVEASVLEVDGHSIAVPVSIGGAMSTGQSADDLSKSADDALYHAKAQGRNRVVMAPDEAGG